MSVKQFAKNQTSVDNQYWKHSSYKGNTVSIHERPIESINSEVFKKQTEDKVLQITEMLKWEKTMFNKYGPDWKKVMKKEKLFN